MCARPRSCYTFAVLLSAKFTCIFTLCVRYGHLNTYYFFPFSFSSCFFFFNFSFLPCYVVICVRACMCVRARARAPHKVAASERAWSLIIWYLGAFVVDTIGMRFICWWQKKQTASKTTRTTTTMNHGDDESIAHAWRIRGKSKNIGKITHIVVTRCAMATSTLVFVRY